MRLAILLAAVLSVAACGDRDDQVNYDQPVICQDGSNAADGCPQPTRDRTPSRPDEEPQPK